MTSLPLSDTERLRAQDADVAEKLFGWRTFVSARQLRFTDPTNTLRTPIVPFYSSDFTACRSMEEKLVADGLGEAYATELTCMIRRADPQHVTPPMSIAHTEILNVLMASCEQRVKAALEVVK